MVFLVFVSACGGAQFTTPTGGDAEGSTDSAAAGDSADDRRASPDGASPTFACGTSSCVRGSQVCCVSPSLATSCGAGTCPGGTAKLACATSATCGAGLVCCIGKQNGNSVSQCAAACGQGEAQLCDALHPDTRCSAAAPCSSNNIDSWNLAAPFGTCGGVQG
jgi:hypothetical protein